MDSPMGAGAIVKEQDMSKDDWTKTEMTGGCGTENNFVENDRGVPDTETFLTITPVRGRGEEQDQEDPDRSILLEPSLQSGGGSIAVGWTTAHHWSTPTFILPAGQRRPEGGARLRELEDSPGYKEKTINEGDDWKSPLVDQVHRESPPHGDTRPSMGVGITRGW